MIMMMPINEVEIMMIMMMPIDEVDVVIKIILMIMMMPIDEVDGGCSHLNADDHDDANR